MEAYNYYRRTDPERFHDKEYVSALYTVLNRYHGLYMLVLHGVLQDCDHYSRFSASFHESPVGFLETEIDDLRNQVVAKVQEKSLRYPEEWYRGDFSNKRHDSPLDLGDAAYEEIVRRPERIQDKEYVRTLYDVLNRYHRRYMLVYWGVLREDDEYSSFVHEQSVGWLEVEACDLWNQTMEKIQENPLDYPEELRSGDFSNKRHANPPDLVDMVYEEIAKRKEIDIGR